MHARPHPKTARHPRRLSGAERGVSLIELLVVITIIGIFVALAGPTIVSTMQDRHAARGADEVVGLFRRARTHAASSGGAHLVRVIASGSNLRFELREAVDPITKFPQSNCQTTLWTATGTDNLVLDTVDFDSGPSYALKNIRASGPVNDVCISPGGTVYVRSGGSWTRPGGAVHMDYVIERLDDTGTAFGFKRTIHVGIGVAPHIEVSG
jgi:prepilin-type N-terminal cleavage/methylation domain-containing protein